ncbi:rhodanese-like domain-containing protein [Vibrio parahaemolyticus]|uniref:rhodanese-like domain-containing protein n=1 Tax=Vibrio parahaemolyticus TaxID=670 RepID=UPI00193D00E2|nr:rhodanese-like domain-containing protein [Vibrio parahaemolyticus]EGR2758523.1 rhodanese-like domain-containing protein [Vibrio parahaemolyticus]EJG0733961.1 rhodanese-like domain-containing protein [Vibrio parahaemolyticus]EJG0789442.1 rhodanese-like domain-containing protein [Vibrio parahaemolyticus]MBM4905816.1 rhodanese-like domain-containing protein [Vibrio parahaemolyticus]MBM5092117.1 rhodanese-like domain-containing protein [Vibrio parahaemolyticus]
MKKAISLFLAMLSLGLLAPNVAASERAEQGWQLIEQGAMIVDVRTPQEFSEGHLDNAVNFPLSELDKHFKDVKKDQLIVLYCRSGNRSGQAYQYLQSQGFTNLHNAGGLEELQNAQ